MSLLGAGQAALIFGALFFLFLIHSLTRRLLLP